MQECEVEVQFKVHTSKSMMEDGDKATAVKAHWTHDYNYILM